MTAWETKGKEISNTSFIHTRREPLFSRKSCNSYWLALICFLRPKEQQNQNCYWTQRKIEFETNGLAVLPISGRILKSRTIWSMDSNIFRNGYHEKALCRCNICANEPAINDVNHKPDLDSNLLQSHVKSKRFTNDIDLFTEHHTTS